MFIFVGNLSYIMNFSEDILNRLWEKASKVEGLDEHMYRKDACGALIMRDKYGKINPYGWVIDHIFPQALGGDNNPQNLRVMHYLNNISKADDYPSYMTAVRFNGQKNVPQERNVTVNQKRRQILKEIYPNA
ncbi:MAG: hypothetical protein IJD32_02125 [Bacteroidaceae bacterium]|nr:hypothetical protein [Bacteroidaceae bacterium]